MNRLTQWLALRQIDRLLRLLEEKELKLRNAKRYAWDENDQDHCDALTDQMRECARERTRLYRWRREVKAGL